jgi:hypothetical protein
VKVSSILTSRSAVVSAHKRAFEAFCTQGSTEDRYLVWAQGAGDPLKVSVFGAIPKQTALLPCTWSQPSLVMRSNVFDSHRKLLRYANPRYSGHPV